jgi:hypothetical protein
MAISTIPAAGLVSPITLSNANLTTATITTLNAPSGPLATQNGMTGIARAWAQFAGSGTINGSFNISSITKVTTGRYTVVFTTAMPNANYSIVFGISGQNSTSGNGRIVMNTNTSANGGNPTTTTFYIQTTNSADSALQDQDYVMFTVFSS